MLDRHMKKTILVFLCILSAGMGMAFAQPRVEYKAHEYYENLAFARAIPWYIRAYNHEPKPEYVYRLADCYRRVHDYENAAKWYAEAMTLEYQPPETQFYYAHTLLMTGNYDDAKKNFREYSLSTPNDNRGNRFADGIEFLKSVQKDSIFFTLKHMSFNTANTEFGAVPYEKGIIFASSRIEGTRTVVRQFQWKDTPFLNLIYAEPKDTTGNEWNNGKTLGDMINSKFHESSFTWSPNSEKIYFTRNNYLKKKGTDEKGVILLKIYQATMKGFQIGEVEEVSFNSENYSVTHPSLTADGRELWFSSDMPCGKGGKDIYYVKKQGDGWSAPVNAGGDINTEGDEEFPYKHADGTLYFASDGHPGFGFLDIFKVDTKTNDKQVINMGMPINSAWDDFAVYMNETADTGWLSSNRTGGAGDDDIYQFTIKRPEIEIIVLDSVAELPLENATVVVFDKILKREKTFTTDSTGLLTFPADFGADYEVTVKTIEFEPRKVAINTQGTEPKLLYQFQVRMYNPPPAITAIVIDDATKERLPGTRVDIIKRVNSDTIFRVTDRNGRFAVKLEKNAYYTIQVRRPGYLTYSQNVSTTQTAFDGDTIIPLKMEPIQIGKAIVLENIHYDFDQWTLRADAYPDLNKVLMLMRDNPGIKVELSSHTDSRGSDDYNLRLSRRRASSARLYLLQSGIEPERILGAGYGETQPVNRCTNGVPCSEDEHFANRRTEFKIIGYVDGYDMESSVLETSGKGQPAPKYVPEDPSHMPKNVDPVVTPKQEEQPKQEGNITPKVEETKTDEGSQTIADKPVENTGVSIIGDDQPKEEANPGYPSLKYNVVEAEQDNEPRFRVRIGAFSSPVGETAFRDLGDWRQFLVINKDNDMLLYSIGDFRDYERAKECLRQLRSLGYNGAFVAAYRNNKQLSFMEMIELIGQ